MMLQASMTSRLVFIARRRLAVVALQLTALGVPHLAVAQGASAAAEAEDTPQARYRRATEAFKHERYDEARQLLISLWKEKPSYEVAKTLVQVEFNLGHRAAAAQYLSWVLANLPPRESQSNIDDFKASLADLKNTVGTARVIVNQPDADIRVDGESRGRSPLAEALFLDIGKHTVEASLGADVATKTIDVVGGSAQDVSLELPAASTPAASGPAPSTAPPPAPASRPETDRREGKSLVPVAIGAGLFVAGLGTGFGFRIAAGSDYDRADELRSKNGAGGCSNGTAPPEDCEAQHDANESGDTKTSISTASFVFAGVAAAATATYWFWPKSQSSQGGTSNVRVQALGGREGAFVGLSGNF